MSETAVKTQSTAAAQQPYLTGSVVSKDGTIISYRQLGDGPGVVILHGAMESPGLGHGASGNTNRGGQPERVARELRRFFA